MQKLIAVLLIATLLLTALPGCSIPPAVSDAKEFTPTPVTSPEAPLQTETPANDAPTKEIQNSVEAEEVSFTVSDEQVLHGQFLPAKIDGAPIIILLHQFSIAPDFEWRTIAPWLQNRGFSDGMSISGGATSGRYMVSGNTHRAKL